MRIGGPVRVWQRTMQNMLYMPVENSPIREKEIICFADMEKELLLAVYAEKGATQITPVDSASREAVRRRLYTPGELLRLDQLRPEPKLFGDRLPLFDGAGL